MYISILFIVISLLSFILFFAVFFQVKKHAAVYRMSKRVALNCKCAFFRRRMIMIYYMLSLIVLTSFIAILIFSKLF